MRSTYLQIFGKQNAPFHSLIAVLAWTLSFIEQSALLSGPRAEKFLCLHLNWFTSDRKNIFEILSRTLIESLFAFVFSKDSSSLNFQLRFDENSIRLVDRRCCGVNDWFEFGIAHFLAAQLNCNGIDEENSLNSCEKIDVFGCDGSCIRTRTRSSLSTFQITIIVN